MEITFRPARPSDWRTAVPLVWASGPALLDHCYGHGGRSSSEFIGAAFQDGRGFLGWRNHTAAVVDGRVVGVGAFYSGGEYGRLSREHVAQTLAHLPLRAALGAVARSLHVRALMPGPARSAHYVANLGVAAEVRSHGVGAALLAYGEREAVRLGRATFELDVTTDNPRARTLYERLGFAATGHRTSTRSTLPGAVRMVRVVPYVAPPGARSDGRAAWTGTGARTSADRTAAAERGSGVTV